MSIPKLSDAAAYRQDEAIPQAPEPTLEGGADAPYSEETFRYLLNAERKRVERSRRSLLLLLTRMKSHHGDECRIDSPTAAAVFAGLRECVREVDFVGWYRTGLIAGAVLPQRGDAPAPEICRSIAARAMQTLADRLPAADAKRIRVRVIEVRPGMHI